MASPCCRCLLCPSLVNIDKIALCRICQFLQRRRRMVFEKTNAGNKKKSRGSRYLDCIQQHIFDFPYLAQKTNRPLLCTHEGRYRNSNTQKLKTRSSARLHVTRKADPYQYMFLHFNATLGSSAVVHSPYQGNDLTISESVYFLANWCQVI